MRPVVKSQANICSKFKCRCWYISPNTRHVDVLMVLKGKVFGSPKLLHPIPSNPFVCRKYHGRSKQPGGLKICGGEGSLSLTNDTSTFVHCGLHGRCVNIVTSLESVGLAEWGCVRDGGGAVITTDIGFLKPPEHGRNKQ